jgi:hypothetical protein
VSCRNRQLGLQPFEDAQDGAVVDEVGKIDTRRAVMPVSMNASGLLPADRDQLEREIAAIERASAALRKADPELESWTDLPATMLQKPRRVWLFIGVLSLSTALVTIGAAFAISALVG